MASSSIPCQARSVLSYHDDLWHISWGEKDSIAAVKAEMARAVQPSPWQSAAPSLNDSSPLRQVHAQSQGKPPANFQPVYYMMTRIPGMQCAVPAMVFSTQQEQLPVQPTPLRTALRSAQPYKPSVASHESTDTSARAEPRRTQDAARPMTSRDHEEATDPLQQGLTLETFEGELPSIGSEGHFDGSCKRCAFFSKGRCKNGKDCTHCHFAHEPRSRLRKRTAIRARKSAQDDVSTLAPEEELADTIPTEETKDVLSEVLSYLSEPNTVPAFSLDETEDTSSDSDTDQVVEKVSKDALGAASITKFNSVLEEISKAYASESAADLKVKDADQTCDTVDIDTTPSVSALSDCDKGVSSETSDSEVASSPSLTFRKQCSFSSSPSSWGAMRKVSSHGDCTTADIERITRSLLNKLTAERFESLCNKILALPLTTPEHLAVVAAEIFAKATTQDCFRTLYTELCMRLDTHLAAQTGVIGGKAFRKALVTECQATFERHLQPADPSIFLGLTDEESFEVHMKLKTRRLGNMRFIGDLLVRRLLAPKLLPQIVQVLLNGDEDALESLIALVMVVAPEFEGKQPLYQAPLRDAFQVLRRKLKEKSICSRMCCQINDLLDAKARSWAPRTTCA